MSAKGTEAPKPGTEAGPAAAPAEAGAKKGGALQTWLPLIVSLVIMPVLAYATTTFILLPKLVQASGGGKPAAHGEAAAEKGGEHGEHGGGGHGGKEAEGKDSGKEKYTAVLDKVLVNVAGSMGTRYLLTKMTLVSDNSSVKTLIEKNADQLRDLASSTLGAKTITDLEKPGARNQIRSELITSFNSALGNPVVKEIYFTEFAIQ
ncbi:MAG TPA: flagellar basal body-associated FliL family protein [Verrucomicrobiae bacterium]|nr:flagellar basal body-associated FliL family protein [Verrucomicrobiae bacterium]